jgi:hypothetical protein
MPRKKRDSDETYNARRRYRRQAERFIKKADESSGILKSRYEAQARSATINALSTYAKGQQPKGRVKQLTEMLGVDAKTVQQVAFAKGMQFGGVSTGLVSRLVQRSKQTLVSAETRDEMAKEILSTGNVGSRFYGGLVDIWGDTPEHREHPNQSILDFFGTDSMMDVIEDLEAEGIDLYTPDENEDVYKSAQLALQQYILKVKRVNEQLAHRGKKSSDTKAEKTTKKAPRKSTKKTKKSTAKSIAKGMQSGGVSTGLVSRLVKQSRRKKAKQRRKNGKRR